jgi:uncharacterized protein (TIGR03083 family)
MIARSNDVLVDVVDDVLVTTLSIVRDLGEDDADLPTDCPGWSVRDQLAHMVGLEQVLNGAPQPTVDLPPLTHVVSDVDVFMERSVHIRRQLPLASIADELAGFRPRRIAELRRLAADGDPSVIGPFGSRPLSTALPIRVFDLWAHEQDIRRAVGLPVRVVGVAADIALERSLQGWSAGLPKQLDGLDAEIFVHVTGPTPSETHITVGAGGSSAAISGDLGEITRLFCGRTTPSSDTVAGDPAVVAALRDRLAMTP